MTGHTDPLTTRPARTQAIERGLMRHLARLNIACLAEFTLASGRRADIFGVRPDGSLIIIEIKSGLPDFYADQKWPDYVQWCDAFYFAIDRDMPQDILPQQAGLILADGYGAEIMREPIDRPRLSAARRKALWLRFGQVAAQRLRGLLDPDANMTI